MKRSIAAPLLTLATLTFHATAAVVDYVSGEPISSSGYYQYHTKWITTTCYQTITKTKDCSGGSGDFAGDYETVSPEVYPGQDYSDYKTVYETVYETAYPYPSEKAPYGTAQPYPHETVCYPETIYSTVYPESSDINYHTFTASGVDETVTGSPVYHTMNSTIMETVTATPSGGSGLECGDTPNLLDGDFEDRLWPGPWYPSGLVSLVEYNGITQNADLAVEFHEGGVLEQALILASGRTYNIAFSHRQSTGLSWTDTIFDGNFIIKFSFGSYVSSPLSFPADQTVWSTDSVNLHLDGSSECLTVVLSIQVTLENDNLEFLPKVLQMDNFVITPVSDT